MDPLLLLPLLPLFALARFRRLVFFETGVLRGVSSPALAVAAAFAYPLDGCVKGASFAPWGEERSPSS